MPGSNYVYTARKAVLSVAGASYDVMSLDLNLELGAIPEVIVGIAPNAAGSAGTNIHSLSLSDVCSTLNKLIKASDGLARGTVGVQLDMFDASRESGKGRSDSCWIKLDNWILKGAGIDNVSTTSGFTMTCTLAHPALELCMDGGFFTNVGCSLNLADASMQATNIVEAGEKAYQCLYNAINANPLSRISDEVPISPSGMSSVAILAEVVKRLGNVSGKIRKYLKWNALGMSNLPLGDVLTQQQLYSLKYLMCMSWLGNDGGSEHSVWDSFMSLASSMGCVLVPQYDEEQLTVCPRFPWADPSVEISEDDTYSILFPGTDPSPLFGVCSSPSVIGGNNDRMNSYFITAGEQNEMGAAATSLAFVPSSSDKNGVFMTVTIPPWLDAVTSFGAGFGDQRNTSGDWSRGAPPKEEKPAGDSTQLKARNSAEMKYLSAVFCNQYKLMMQARVNCRFMPKLGGRTLFPGRVAAVKTQSGDTLFEGYVTTVTHHVSMPLGRASTNIMMNHCRPAGGYDITKGYGKKNPLY